MNEIWVPAIYIQKNGKRIDFTGLYEVSNLGNVRGLDRLDSINRNRKGKPINKQLWGEYLSVLLHKNNKNKKCTVHRLTLSSFNPEGWFKGAVCNHKNEIKTDNRIENLEWVTYQDNLNYGNRNRKASESLYQAGRSIAIIQDNCKEWVSAADAERFTGIDSGNITKCCMGKRKTAGGSTWKYKY